MQRELVFPSPTLESRYWSHVEKRGPDECWPWIACTVKGYGKIWVGYDADGVVIMRRSNRVGWMLVHGKDPGRQHVRHTCDNPSCCNPAHWELGSHADNMHDMQERGRKKQVRGEKVGGAKLSEERVRQIRAMRADGYKLREIGLAFGVHLSTVAYVCNGKNWRHIE